LNEPAEISLSEFAATIGYRKSYVTALRKAGRLVLSEDGQRVRVAESLALIESTRSPAHQGVADRHAAARTGADGQRVATVPATPASAAPEPGQADDEPDDTTPTSPHSERRAKALADKEEALARKAERDEQLELGQLLRTADVESALADAAATLRGALEALPYDLAPELAPITDEGQLRARLVDAIESLLTELSRRFGAMAKREAAS
jgi:hypothetical protein